MNPFAEFETDPTKERDGVRVVVRSRKPEGGAMTFILRRAGGANRIFRYAMAEAIRNYPEILSDIETPDGRRRAFNVEDQATQEAFADAVIAGWENVEGRDGQPLAFTRDNVLDLIRACPDVWDELRVAAVDVANFRPNGAAKDGAELGKS